MEEQAVNNPIQQPNIPTPQKPKHSSFLTSKLFLITLTIVVLFTIVYAGIYLYLGSQLDQISKSSPTPLPAETSVKEKDPTANWKTYTNTVYNFEIAFPKNWYVPADLESKEGKLYQGKTFSISNYDPSDQKNFDLKNMKLSDKQKNPLRIDVGIFTVNKESLEDIKNRLIKNSGSSDGGDSIFVGMEKVSETKFASHEALSVTYQNKSVSQIFVLNKNNYLYEIDTYFEPTSSNHKLIDQILATFNFTDQEGQVVCTQDAKLCPDGKTYVGRRGPNCEFAKCP